jgi:predicted nucleic acid-binding protein
MGSPTSLTDSRLVIADASIVINLNATGCARDIVQALPHKLAVVDVVQGELEDGRRNGRRDADLLNRLAADGLLEIVQLEETATAHFESLVIGSAITTLDDGEAATIAYAITAGAIAALDERKATGLCARRFPTLDICSTVDILARPEVLHKLGNQGLSDAVYRALLHGRMRVFPQHVEWVLGLIGPEQAAECTSLPKGVRPTRTL